MTRSWFKGLFPQKIQSPYLLSMSAVPKIAVPGPGGAPLPAVQLTFRSIGRVERTSDVAFDVTNVAFMVTYVTF